MDKGFFVKLKNSYRAFLTKLAERPLTTIIFLFLIVLVLGAILFYQYDILTKNAEPKGGGESIRFQQELYHQVLQEWQAREARFAQAGSQDYINPFLLGPRATAGTGEKKLSTVRTQELLSNPQIQELLKVTNLYQFYEAKGETFLTIDERAKIWQELELGQEGEYQGSYNQNIKLLSELKKELTK